MKLYKLNFYKARLKRLNDELTEINSDINLILLLGGRKDVIVKRKEYIIKKVEQYHKEQMDFEKTIEDIEPFDKEVLLRRYKGNTYEKIAKDLQISVRTVKGIVYKYRA